MRLLYRLYLEIPPYLPPQLPRPTPDRAFCHRRLSPIDFSAGWNFQPRSEIQSVAVSYSALSDVAESLNLTRGADRPGQKSIMYTTSFTTSKLPLRNMRLTKSKRAIV